MNRVFPVSGACAEVKEEDRTDQSGTFVIESLGFGVRMLTSKTRIGVILANE